MNIIDALVLELGFDTKDLKKGGKEAGEAFDKVRDKASKTGKEVDASAKRMSQGLSVLKSEAVALVGAFLSVAAIKQFVQHITTSDAAVGRLAGNLGMATEELSAWEKMSEKFGGSAGDTDAAFRNINRISQELNLIGNSSALTPLARAGVDMAKFAAKTTTAGDRMRMLVKAASRLSAQDAQTFFQQAGFSEQTVTMMREVGDQLDGALEKQRQLNVVNQRDAEMAKQRQAAMSELTDELERFGRTLATDITPHLIPLLREFTEASRNSGSVAIPILQKIGEGWKNIYDWVKAIGQAINDLMPRSWSNALGAGVSTLFEKLGIKGQVDRLMGLSEPASPAGSVGDDMAAKQRHLADLEKKYNLPSKLLDSVWAQESGRGKNMTSPKGAQGHFQFMPDTARRYGLADANNFEQSSEAAARMYRDLLAMYSGDISKALAAYNFGSGNLAKSGMGGLPAETQKYIASIRSSMGLANAAGPSSTKTEVKIGTVTVVTQATDAKGIARDINTALGSQIRLATQANTGLR